MLLVTDLEQQRLNMSCSANPGGRGGFFRVIYEEMLATFPIVCPISDCERERELISFSDLTLTVALLRGAQSCRLTSNCQYPPWQGSVAGGALTCWSRDIIKAGELDVL